MTQQQQQDETEAAVEKQIDRVRKALTSNHGAIIMIVPDEAHRELAQSAFEKQHKNAVAAKGTILALTKREDPTLDEIIDGLSRLQQITINARPAQHQLDGTPIGRAIEEKQNGKKHGARGGEPTKVGDVLAINWADDVPTPRPAIGELLRVPTGQTTSIAAVWGYHPDAGFEVSDTMDWRGLVYAHNGEWRLVNARTEYTDNAAPELKNQAGDVIDGQTEVPSVESAAKDGSNDTPPEGENWPAGDLAVDNAVDNDEYTITDVEPAPEGSEPLMDVASAEREKTKGGKKRAPRVNRGKIGKGRGGKKSR
jgi:hypothetical protein